MYNLIFFRFEYENFHTNFAAYFLYDFRCLPRWLLLLKENSMSSRVFCVWRGGQDWAAKSPDMSPMDFFLWPYMKVWPVWSMSDVPPDQGWHGYILSARRKMSYVFTMVTQTNPQLPKSNLNFVFGQLPHVIYWYCNSMYCRVQYEGLFWRREEVQMIEWKRGRFPI